VSASSGGNAATAAGGIGNTSSGGKTANVGGGESTLVSGGSGSGGKTSGTGGAKSTGAGGGNTAPIGSAGKSGTAGGSQSAGGSSGTPGDYDTVVSTGEFSFFVVSLAFIKSKAPCTGTTANSGKTCFGGLGGKLGGLDGADALCAEAAQAANPGDKHQWRAFLSVTDYNGAGPVNAIDRIGKGPWYTAPPKQQSKTSYASEGLLLAADVSGLLQTRPNGDTKTIVYSGVNQSSGQGTSQQWPLSQCLLNENGYCTQADGDTHDTMTGTGTDGKLASTDKTSTCDDWTNNTTSYGTFVFGHTWPRQLNTADTSASWLDTGEENEKLSCGAIINVSSTNYFSGGGGPGGGGGSTTTSQWNGGVGSGGGYGAFYCFAYVTGSE
jgi:hypothetical protein